jgi:DNA-binding SARP family transcriptional activator
MGKLCVSLFSRFEAQCDGQTLANFELRKVQELFCYLLLYHDRPHHRENLAGLLWHEATPSQSKSYLRKALWQLQTALEHFDQETVESFLTVDSEWLGLNLSPHLWADVIVLEQTFELVKGLPGCELDESISNSLAQVCDLYRGDLLEGWYQDWCLFERERFQHLYLALLDKLMDYCEAHHAYEEGVTYGTRILYFDQARERTHRRLMRLYYKGNDRTEALRQYERCLEILEKELQVRPSATTTTLYEQIRADRLEDPPTPPTSPLKFSQAAAHSLSEIADSLKRFQIILSDIQQQIEQDIQAVELALRK